MGNNSETIWIARDLARCSGCRKCEIECSLFHENRIWPDVSMIRVFMLTPGLEFPHLCAQCEYYPCVKSCFARALSVSRKTGAVLVNKEICTGCGRCIKACPGGIPHMHPRDKHVVICDLCDGDPKCVKVCQEAGWNVLEIVPRKDFAYHLYARKPEEISQDLASNIYGDKVEGHI